VGKAPGTINEDLKGWKKFMAEKIIRGVIENVETGESHEVSHYLFLSDLELTTIVKINKVESYLHPDNSIQVSVDCQALDCIGSVFDLNLEFSPGSIEERDQLLEDMKVDSIFPVKGQYGVSRSAPICLFEPAYRFPEPDFPLEEVREAFRINSGKDRK